MTEFHNLDNEVRSVQSSDIQNLTVSSLNCYGAVLSLNLHAVNRNVVNADCLSVDKLHDLDICLTILTNNTRKHPSRQKILHVQLTIHFYTTGWLAGWFGCINVQLSHSGENIADGDFSP